jgi:uncharacterized membrane protein
VYIEHNADEFMGGIYRGVFTIEHLRVHHAGLEMFLASNEYSKTVRNSMIWLHMPWNNASI